MYEKNYGKDGKPLKGADVNAEGRVEYDKCGNIVSLIVLNGYGKPAIGSAGFHKLERKYNDNNKVECEQYKDTNGKLVKHKTYGYAKITYTYDDKRNLIMEKYFNTSGNVTGYSTYKYNERNAQTEICLYDANKNLDDSKYGFAKIAIVYSNDGVTPQKRIFYNRFEKQLAWQYYNTQTGEWGNLIF